MNLVLHWTGVALVYAGLAALLAGGACIVKPMRWLRIGSRGTAARVLAAGFVLFAVGALLPAPLRRATDRREPIGVPDLLIDAEMPQWQFSEFHELRVRATPEAVWRAVLGVTADEIFLFRTLTWIRNPHFRRTREDILNAPAHKPILDVAQTGGFRLLGVTPAESSDANEPREIVLGALVGQLERSSGGPLPRTADELRARLAEPGNAVATINFRIVPEGGGWVRVTTETRVFATNDAMRRRFAAYWRVIYPGSSILRITWLRAIRTRAERNATRMNADEKKDEH